MTAEQIPQVTPWDTGNPFAPMILPHNASCQVVENHLAFTLRVGTGTLTAWWTHDELKKVMAILEQMDKQMGSGLIIPPKTIVLPQPPNGKRDQQ
jgi:hypothetical protein